MQTKRTTIFILFFMLAGMATACDNKNDLCFLKEKMPYVEARKLLIDHGWKPFSFGVTDGKEIIPACLKRITSCVVSDTSDHCQSQIDLCSTWPEIETMTSNGYVLTVMENNKGKKIFISMYGSTNIIHREHEPAITGWRFSERTAVTDKK